MVTTTTPATRESNDVKIERFQRNLRVTLTQKEIADRAQRAAHLLKERDQKDEEAKAASKHAKAQIAEVEAELRRVSGEIRDGATYKDVQCHRVHNYRLGKIEEIRLDTNDVIAERAMTDRERQLDFALEKPAAGSSNGKKAANDEDEPEEVVTLPDDVDEVEASAPDEVPEPGRVVEYDDAEYGEEVEAPLATQKPAKKRGRPRKNK